MDGLQVSKRVLRYAGRDIIRVILPCGTRHGFYRSSGRNSGKPGQWLPFDGLDIRGRDHGKAWFHKSRFCEHVAPENMRFGWTYLRMVSDALGKMRIRSGEEETPSTINTFLRTCWARQIAARNSAWFQARRAEVRATKEFFGQHRIPAAKRAWDRETANDR